VWVSAPRQPGDTTATAGVTVWNSCTNSGWLSKAEQSPRRPGTHSNSRVVQGDQLPVRFWYCSMVQAVNMDPHARSPTVLYEQ
jgi:hypothetical protein